MRWMCGNCRKLDVPYQGVSDIARRGKKYGDIPWRLGLKAAK
jgi:hypothetical protein